MFLICFWTIKSKVNILKVLHQQKSTRRTNRAMSSWIDSTETVMWPFGDRLVFNPRQCADAATTQPRPLTQLAAWNCQVRFRFASTMFRGSTKSHGAYFPSVSSCSMSFIGRTTKYGPKTMTWSVFDFPLQLEPWNCDSISIDYTV